MLEMLDEFHRDRLRTMLSVDDMIDSLLTRLDNLGVLVATATNIEPLSKTDLQKNKPTHFFGRKTPT